jgi:hypothetical protein
MTTLEPRVDGQVHIRENLQRTVGLAEALGRKRGPAAGRRIREAERGHAVVFADGLQPAEQPLGPLGHVLGRDGLGGLRPHLVGLVKQDLGLLFGVGTFTLAGPLVGFALGEVALPVHVVEVDLRAVGVEQEDLVDGGFEQLGVVADHDQTALVVFQEVTQPGDGIGVEVVGRFVEEHGLGVRVEDPGQLHTAALATGERLEGLVQQTVRQRQVGADRRGLGFGSIAACREELGLEPVIAVHRLALYSGILAGHLFVGKAELADGDVQAADGQDPVARKLLHVRGAGILGQVADLTGAGHLAGSGQPLPCENAGERGLARSVAAHQADLVSLVDAEAHLVHQEPGAGTQFKILDSNHSR